MAALFEETVLSFAIHRSDNDVDEQYHSSGRSVDGHRSCSEREIDDCWTSLSHWNGCPVNKLRRVISNGIYFNCAEKEIKRNVV